MGGGGIGIYGILAYASVGSDRVIRRSIKIEIGY